MILSTAFHLNSIFNLEKLKNFTRLSTRAKFSASSNCHYWRSREETGYAIPSIAHEEIFLGFKH